MKRNSHLGGQLQKRKRSQPKRPNDVTVKSAVVGSPSFTQIDTLTVNRASPSPQSKLPKCVEVESTVLGIPGLKRFDILAVEEEPETSQEPQPEVAPMVPPSLTPVRTEDTEPAFGHHLGRHT